MTAHAGHVAPRGRLGLHIVRNDGSGLGRMLSTPEIIAHGFPRKGLPEEVNNWREDNAYHHLARGWKLLAARAVALRAGMPFMWSQLWLQKTCADGRVLDLGLAGFRVVTTVGVGYIVDAFQNSVELEEMKYHAFGTGTNAEAAGDTGLQTELTTQYASNNIRPTGTTTEGASANIYRTVGSLDPDADVAITEHGIMSDVDVGQGVLLDRTVFSVVNVDDAGDTLQATYELTFPSGS